MTQRPAWYGGNKIPASYLAKFHTAPQDNDGIPQDLRFFLNDMGFLNGSEQARPEGQEHHAQNASGD